MKEINQKTIIVAGCTRSGLTLMMQILNKGGYPCFGEYPAFEGYEIGKIDYNQADGKAIKLVDTHNQFAPKGEYYIIRMRRDLKQQSKSIIKFIKYLGIPVDKRELNNIKKSLQRDYAIIDEWAIRQKDCMYVDFEVLIDNSQLVIDKIKKAFDIKLSDNAINCVIKRGANCYNGMLEEQWR